MPCSSARASAAAGITSPTVPVDGAVAAVATPLAKQDAPNPPSSNPPSRPEGPVFEVPRSPALSRASGIALDLSDEQKFALVSLRARASL